MMQSHVFRISLRSCARASGRTTSIHRIETRLIARQIPSVVLIASKTQIREYASSKRKATDSLKREPLAPVKRIDTLRDDIAEKLRLSRTIEGRKELGKFVIEGSENIRAAIEAGVKINTIAVREDIWDSGTLDIVLKNPGSVNVISERIMKHIFSQGALPEVVALADELHPTFKEISAFASMKRLLILDDIINPRNVGGLLHVGEAYGIQGVLMLTSQKTDKGAPIDLLLSRHSLKSSLGAIFRVPTLLTTQAELLEFLKSNKFNSIALDNQSPLSIDLVPQDATELVSALKTEARKEKLKLKAKKLKKTKGKVAKKKKVSSSNLVAKSTVEDELDDSTNDKVAILVGNETKGVSEPLLGAAITRIGVPTRVPVLNVNVSVGILLNHLFGRKDAAALRSVTLSDLDLEEE